MFSEHPLSCSLKNSQTSQNSRTWETRNLSTSNGVQKTLKHLAGSCHIHWILSSGRIWNLFLGAFAKLRKATVSFVMSACLSVSTEQLGSHWTIFMKFYIQRFFENLSRKFKFYCNLTRITSTLHEILYMKYFTWNALHEILYVKYFTWSTLHEILYVNYFTWNILREVLYMKYFT
jgi:hypothetical protein